MNYFSTNPHTDRNNFRISMEMSHRLTFQFSYFIVKILKWTQVQTQLYTHTHTYTHIQTNARNHKRKNLNTHLFKSISLLYAWLGTKPSSDGIKNGAFEFVSNSLRLMTILYIEWDFFITIRNIKYRKVFSARRLTPLHNYWMIQVIKNTNIFSSYK